MIGTSIGAVVHDGQAKTRITGEIMMGAANGFRRSALALVVAGLLAGGTAPAAMVRFEIPAQTVHVNGILDLNILIEYGPGEPSDLFSFGLRVEVLDPGATDLIALDLPLMLDHNGVNGAPAMTDLSPGVMGAKGTINVFDMPPVPYTDNLLATYRMQFGSVGTVRLQLQPYNTLGPTEDIFVSGDGAILDDFIVYGNAEVIVVPEPALLVSGLVATLVLLSVRRRH